MVRVPIARLISTAVAPTVRLLSPWVGPFFQASKPAVSGFIRLEASFAEPPGLSEQGPSTTARSASPNCGDSVPRLD